MVLITTNHIAPFLATVSFSVELDLLKSNRPNREKSVWLRDIVLTMTAKTRLKCIDFESALSGPI